MLVGVGGVYPFPGRKRWLRGCGRESTSRDRLHVCGRATMPALHPWMSKECYYLSAFFIFSPPFALASHVTHPGQDARLRHPEQVDDKAAYTFPLIAGSQRIVSEMKMMTRACRGSQSSARPEPKCFKWITPVCHCDYTLLAATATRWIVFYGFAADLFFPFFPSLHRCECIFPSLYVTKHGLNAGLFSSFEPPHNHSICHVSLRGRFLFISQWSGWLRDHVYVWIFTLRKWYFRLGLACFCAAKKAALVLLGA